MIARRRTKRRCHRCGYDLRSHLPGARCPECGEVVLAPWESVRWRLSLPDSDRLLRVAWVLVWIGATASIFLEPGCWPALWLMWILAASAWLDRPCPTGDDR